MSESNNKTKKELQESLEKRFVSHYWKKIYKLADQDKADSSDDENLIQYLAMYACLKNPKIISKNVVEEIEGRISSYKKNDK